MYFAAVLSSCGEMVETMPSCVCAEAPPSWHSSNHGIYGRRYKVYGDGWMDAWLRLSMGAFSL
jgi:hypothetical protein